MHFRIDGNGYGGGSHGGGAGGHGGLSGGGSVVDAVAGTIAGSALPSANAVTAADFGHGLHGPSARSRSSSSDPRHLTGEMINRMNAFRKKDNATIAASLADCHRQQMQMQAIYERALRVSFLKVLTYLYHFLSYIRHLCAMIQYLLGLEMYQNCLVTKGRPR